MKDMGQNTRDFQSNASSGYNNNTYRREEARSTSAKGDYIDFEEVK